MTAPLAAEAAAGAGAGAAEGATAAGAGTAATGRTAAQGTQSGAAQGRAASQPRSSPSSREAAGAAGGQHSGKGKGKGKTRRGGRGSSSRRVLVAEFIGAMIIVALSPLTDQHKQDTAAKLMQRLTAVCALWLVLGLVATGGRGASRVATWFGGLVLVVLVVSDRDVFVRLAERFTADAQPSTSTAGPTGTGAAVGSAAGTAGQAAANAVNAANAAGAAASGQVGAAGGAAVAGLIRRGGAG